MPQTTQEDSERWMEVNRFNIDGPSDNDPHTQEMERGGLRGSDGG